VDHGGEKVRGRRALILAAAVALVATACGARLSKSQLATIRSGTGASSGLAAGSPAAATGASGAATGGGASSASGGASPSGVSGAATGAGSSGGGTGAATGSKSSASGPSSGTGGSGCPAGAPSSDPGVSATSINIGMVTTLTGPVPGVFNGAVHGTQAWVNYINSQGGLCGRQVKLTPEDDNLDPAQFGAQVDSLKNKVFAFVGNFSVVDEGGSQQLQASGAPDISYALSAAHEAIPNNFSPQPAPPGWPLGAFNYFKQRFGPSVITKMALFIQNAGSVTATGLAEKAAAESVGYKFVFSETAVEPTQTDFTNEVNTMQRDGVQGILFVGDAQAMGEMASQMYSAGYKIPLGNWGANAYDPLFLQQAGPGAEGAILNQDLALYGGEDAATVPEVKTFDDWFHRSYPGATPDIFAAYGWLDGLMFAQAVNGAGALSRPAVLKFLQGLTNFTGNGMIATDGPGTKTPPTCYTLIDVKGGKFVRDKDNPSGYRCGDGGYFRT
jgi:ABC-type branched-subunit amino acid transport system substrate-binding protein